MATTSLQVAKDLSRQLKSTEPDSQRCLDLLNQLEKQVNEKAIAMHKLNIFLSTLKKAQKSFRVQKRSASDKTVWDGLLEQTGNVLTSLQALENSSRSSDDAMAGSAMMPDTTEGLPPSKFVYLSRLKNQKKELYKDPPVLPPSKVTIEEAWVELPKRNKRTHCLTFPCGQDSSLRELLKDFKPNQTPGEVLRAGAFGGTYFRSIVSAVTNKKYRGQDVVRDTIPNEWIKGLDQKMYLTSATYRPSINMFRAKCGGSLGMWESSGWIADTDPYGWFQWYCRFFRGRRTSDDARQISRWKGVAGLKGRFRSQLCNKIIKANATADDANVSPVIRQTLLHWGLLITDDILEIHKQRTGQK